MLFDIYKTITIQGVPFTVIGSIQYICNESKNTWQEYHLQNKDDESESWLTYEESDHEFLFMPERLTELPIQGLRQTECGTQEVLVSNGYTRVDVGDKAEFIEYITDDQKVISVEKWKNKEDMTEMTEIFSGFYLDFDDVKKAEDTGGETDDNSEHQTSKPSKFHIGCGPIILIFFVIMMIVQFCSGPDDDNTVYYGNTAIKDYLASSSEYTYVTSVVGTYENLKADVYISSMPFDNTVKAIIDTVEVSDVQQNDEAGDQSVGIMTPEEYCLVYHTVQDKVLVQNSPREYAYSSDKAPYGASESTHNYYRSFYFTYAFMYDRSRYTAVASPYLAYSGSKLSSKPSDSYKSYKAQTDQKRQSSNSIRQRSTGVRTTKGGGISMGK